MPEKILILRTRRYRERLIFLGTLSWALFWAFVGAVTSVPLVVYFVNPPTYL